MPEQLTAELIEFYTWFESLGKSSGTLLEEYKQAFMAGQNAGYRAGWRAAQDEIKP